MPQGEQHIPIFRIPLKSNGVKGLVPLRKHDVHLGEFVMGQTSQYLSTSRTASPKRNCSKAQDFQTARVSIQKSLEEFG